MLVFEPQLFHFDVDRSQTPTPADLEEELPANQPQIFKALRDENKALANQVITSGSSTSDPYSSAHDEE